jgi:hemolysin III
VKTEKSIKRDQTEKEELYNALTHGFGALLSLAGLILLLFGAINGGDPWRIVSLAIYGTSLVLLYTASTLYHFEKNEKRKKYLKIFDHSSIYLLIAGSYTPFMLVTINGKWGWIIFSIVWSIAIIGIVFKLKYVGQFKRLSLALYLAMGWVIIIVIKYVIEALPMPALVLLILGGLSYSGGTWFYSKSHKPYYHAIWHLFVIGGSVLQFLAIYLYVMPIPTI